MRTISRLIRRYILAAFAIVLLVLMVNGILLAGIVIRYGSKSIQEGFFPVGKFAESFTRTEDGYAPSADYDWKPHFAWAMLLSDSGEILWSEDLPEELNHPYTVPEVAAFSRWYLKDYPVMVYRNNFGLLVAGKPKGSMTRFDFYMDNDILYALLSTFVPLLLLDLGLVLAICLLLGWRGARPLRALAEGIGCLAEGKEVNLKESGATAELAGGQTSAGTGGGHRAFGRRKGSPPKGIRRNGGAGGKAEPDQPPFAKTKRIDCAEGYDPSQLDCRGLPRHPHPAGTDYGQRRAACPAVPTPVGAAKKGGCHLHPEQKNKGPH